MNKKMDLKGLWGLKAPRLGIGFLLPSLFLKQRLGLVQSRGVSERHGGCRGDWLWGRQWEQPLLPWLCTLETGAFQQVVPSCQGPPSCLWPPSSPRDPTQTHQPREGTTGKPSSIHSTTLYCMLSSLPPENLQSDCPEVQSGLIWKHITLGSKAEAFPGVSGVGGVVYHTDLVGQDCLSFRSLLPHVPRPPHTHTLSFKQPKNSKTTRP